MSKIRGSNIETWVGQNVQVCFWHPTESQKPKYWKKVHNCKSWCCKHVDKSGSTCMYVGKRQKERETAAGFCVMCFWWWKISEMFLNLKSFRRITGTPLSILDNYSFRPTSEGQIASVWEEKRNQSVLKTESDAQHRLMTLDFHKAKDFICFVGVLKVLVMERSRPGFGLESEFELVLVGAARLWLGLRLKHMR